MVLCIGLLRLWVGQFTNDVLDMNEILCKTGIFLGYVCSNTSVWLIVIVTIERFIVVIFPLKAPRFCNRTIARTSIVCVFIVFIFTNIHFTWTVHLQHYRFDNITFSKCQAKQEHEYLVEVTWPWVDASIYSFGPFFFIITLNCLIIRKLFSAKKTRNILRQQSSLSKRKNGNEENKIKGEMSMKITVMLLIVSFTFLITTLPMNLVLIHSSLSAEIDNDDEVAFTKEKLLETLAVMLMYVNHSINFFLYCTTGKKFRDQFRAMFCCCKPDRLFRNISGNSQRVSSSFRLSSYKSKTGTTDIGSPQIDSVQL
jgi:hypothetical protein